jgi:hypothetical protein
VENSPTAPQKVKHSFYITWQFHFKYMPWRIAHMLPGLLVHVCNPSTRETEVGHCWIWGHSRLKASLGYIVRPCLKTTTTNHRCPHNYLFIYGRTRVWSQDFALAKLVLWLEPHLQSYITIYKHIFLAALFIRAKK